LPDYNPFAAALLTTEELIDAPPQLPDYDPLAVVLPTLEELTEAFTTPSQLLDNPLSELLPTARKLPDYNPLAKSFSTASRLPDYDSFTALISSHLHLPLVHPSNSASGSIPAHLSIHDSPIPAFLPQGDHYLTRDSEHSQLQNYNRHAMHDSGPSIVRLYHQL
jgi:hypothetical protein